MSMVTQFPFSFYQGFATRTYKAKLLKFKPRLIQGAPNVTTVLSGLCKTSSPDSTPSNALQQHQRLSSFIMLVGFSVKPHKTVHNYVSALLMLHDLCSFDSAAFDDIRVKLIFPYASYQSHFRSHLDFRNSAHLALWAALLVGFFTFFRTANLCPPSRETFSSFSTLSLSRPGVRQLQ